MREKLNKRTIDKHIQYDFFNLFYSIAFEKNKAEYLFQTNVKVIRPTELRFYGTV